VETLLQNWAASMLAFRRVTPRGLPSVRPVPWPLEARTETAPELMWSVA